MGTELSVGEGGWGVSFPPTFLPFFGLESEIKQRLPPMKEEGQKRKQPQTAAISFYSQSLTHLSSLAPSPPPSTPLVWNWKIKQRLATMKEEGDKLKNQSSSNSSSSNSGEGLGPLPGEKVIALDENLPDGALEAYWAQLRREREGQGGGGGGGEEKKEEGGKAKRKTIKV